MSVPHPSLRPGRLAALLVALAVLASACSGSPATNQDAAEPTTSSSSAAPSAAVTTPSSPATTSSAAQTPSAAVPEILDFEGRTVAGAEFAGASVAGKPVVLWFWAPWCAVCRSQAPEVTDLADRYSGEVTIVGVGSLDSGDAIAGFAKEFPAITHLSDPDGALWKRFSIVEQSSFVVLDAKGEEVLRTGYSNDDALAGTLADLAGA